MNTPRPDLALSAAPQPLPERRGSSPARLTRLLRLAELRGDLAAAAILRARIASVPWRPEPEAPPMLMTPWAGLRWAA